MFQGNLLHSLVTEIPLESNRNVCDFPLKSSHCSLKLQTFQTLPPSLDPHPLLFFFPHQSPKGRIPMSEVALANHCLKDHLTPSHCRALGPEETCSSSSSPQVQECHQEGASVSMGGPGPRRCLAALHNDLFLPTLSCH